MIVEAGKVTGSANDLRKLNMGEMKALLLEIGYPSQVPVRNARFLGLAGSCCFPCCFSSALNGCCSSTCMLAVLLLFQELLHAHGCSSLTARFARCFPPQTIDDMLRWDRIGAIRAAASKKDIVARMPVLVSRSRRVLVL